MNSVQDRIDHHIKKFGNQIISLKKDIERLTLDWGLHGYYSDVTGMIVSKYMPWVDMKSTYKTALSKDKLYNIMQLESIAPPGAAAEFGVFTGGVTRMLLDKGRNVDAYDTFNGIAGAGPDDIHRNGEYNGGDVLDYIKGADVYCGEIPSTLQSGKKYAFVHLDLDVYAPTKAVLEYLYNGAAASGCILVMDDYGNATTIGVKKAADEFLSKTKCKSIYFSTSQLVIML